MFKKRKDFIFTHKEAAFSAYFTIFSFMFLHTLYMIFFFVTKVWFMAYFNIFSILFYGYSIFIVKRGKLSLYVLHVYLEVFLHYAAALLCLGFGYGYELVVLAFITVIYQTSYLAENLEKRKLHPSLFCGLFMLLFLFFIGWFKFKEPFYTISSQYADTIKTCSLVFHVILTFVLGSFFLFMFYRQATGLERKIYEVSITDMLTDINNRFGVEERFERIKHAERNDYIVSIIDIDDFKKVNDTYGHKFGDVVLVQVARFFTKELSQNSYFARWGGEEFVILTHIDSSFEQEVEKISAIQRKFANEVLGDAENQLKITFTIGSKTYDNYETLEEWVEKADYNLYKGKKAGKNTHIYN